MSYVRPLTFLCAAFFALVAFCAPSATAHGQGESKAATPGSQPGYPLPPAHHELHKRPEKSQIYQLDDEPIGARKPLLMIHGGQGDVRHLFRWDKAIEHFARSADFNKTYKVYLLRYDSNAMLETTVPESVEAILGLHKDLGGRPIYILALSMGGNVAQLAMANKEVEDAVEVVLAMATPFHGSPLFSADWFQYSLYKSRMMPVLRVMDSLDYRAYFSMHKNYQQDLKWDDSDDLIPQAGFFHSKLPFGPKGYLTLSRDSNSIIARANDDSGIDKKKIIAYAAYLVNPYVLDEHHVRWQHALLSSYRFISTQVRAQLGREQAALMVLNRQISKVDAGPGAQVLGSEGAHVYALNDGITPVTSALFLAPAVCKTHLLLHESDLKRLRGFTDVRQARVFRNINHVTFVEGRPPHHGSDLVVDELHPDEPAKPIFDWMLLELMAAARDTQTAGNIEKSATSAN